MSTLRQQVSEFHIAFEHPTAETPTIPADDRVRLRLRLIAEEFLELIEATGCYTDDVSRAEYFILAAVDHRCFEFDLPAFADALADLDYVIEGARLEFGINGGPIADAVHAANMAKLGADGRPMKRADGKTLKPAGWQPPDIAGELRRQGWKGSAK